MNPFVPSKMGPTAAPEFGVVTEEDARPAPFQQLQPVKRGQHRLAVVHVARQAALELTVTASSNMNYLPSAEAWVDDLRIA